MRIEVVRILGRGTCPGGIEMGRSWIVRSGTVPEGMCGSAFHTLFPYLNALRFGAAFPWWEDGQAEITCPDAENPVVFRLTAEG